MLTTLAPAEMPAPDRPDEMTELRDPWLRCEADVDAAIEVLDRASNEVERSGQAVFADDNEPILLALYGEAGVIAMVDLDQRFAPLHRRPPDHVDVRALSSRTG